MRIDIYVKIINKTNMNTKTIHNIHDDTHTGSDARTKILSNINASVDSDTKTTTYPNINIDINAESNTETWTNSQDLIVPTLLPLLYASSNVSTTANSTSDDWDLIWNLITMLLCTRGQISVSVPISLRILIFLPIQTSIVVLCWLRHWYEY